MTGLLHDCATANKIRCTRLKPQQSRENRGACPSWAGASFKPVPTVNVMHLDLLAASLIGDMLGIEGELGTAAGRQRNNFKMNVLETPIDKFPRIQ
jgi:hypothetical protein